MADRPRIFDDLAGVAGGALSALSGLRDETEALIRARIDEMVRKLELVRREEVEAAMELAGRARAGQEEAEAKLVEVLARVSALESRVSTLEASGAPPIGPVTQSGPPPMGGPRTPEGGGPGMIG